MTKLLENKVQKIMCSDYFSLISGRNALILPVKGQGKQLRKGNVTFQQI